MKNRLLMLSIVTMISVINIYAESRPIPLSDAIRKGLVQATIKGRDRDSSSRFESSYYGQCLTLQLKCLSKSNVSLILENGRFLETLDTSEQRMIVTHEELISLLPGKQKKVHLYAMCTQMHDHSPDDKSLLALGPMASGPLMDLCRFIGQHNFQDQAAQNAIWTITDNNDLSNIYAADANELKLLGEQVSRLTGKVYKLPPQPIDYADGGVSGEIIFENTRPESYSLIMENEQQEKVGTFFTEKRIEKPMLTTLTWRFRYHGFEKGVYYVILLNSKNEVIAKRTVVIR